MFLVWLFVYVGSRVVDVRYVVPPCVVVMLFYCFCCGVVLLM